MTQSDPLPKTEHMPNIAFRLMKWGWKITDLFWSPVRHIKEFGIKPGWTVIDYGCGPGRYIRKASQLVGQNGIVYAVDIHDLAIQSVERINVRYGLTNVIPVKAEGYSTPVTGKIADLIYVLDAFHMVSDHRAFLGELHRLVKPSGRLILEDGHQPRKRTLRKISEALEWLVNEKHRRYLVLIPKC